MPDTPSATPSSPTPAAATPARRIPLPVAFVVIAAAVVLVAWQGYHYFQGRPKSVLDAFLRASEQGDYETMASLLSSTTRGLLEGQGADLTKPELWMPNLFTDGKRVPEQAKVRHEVTKTETMGDSFIATIKTTVETAPSMKPYTQGLVVRRESESTVYRVMTGVVNGKPVLVGAGGRGMGMGG